MAGTSGEGMSPPQRMSRHMPQLDGLRALAVLAVFAQHALPNVAGVRALGPGYYGVVLFFVLSGFLITRILIVCRAAVAEGQSLALTMRRFYARRALRIMPLFYGALVTAAVLDIAPVRETFWWHATYLSNLYFARRGDWHGTVTPFWTLAVEEQFYLAWPWVVLMVPRARLLIVIVALLVACPIVRCWYGFLGVTPFAIGLLPFGNTDYLFIGALLADLEARGVAGTHRRRSLGRLGLAVGLPAYALMIAGAPWPPLVVRAWFSTWLANAALGLFLFWLIDRAAEGFSGLGGRVLSSPPLQAIGRISYGVYVYQTFVIAGLARMAVSIGVRPPASPATDDVAWVAWRLLAVFGVAAVSWRYFEQPIMRLKRYVPYRVRPPRSGAVSLPAAVA